MNYEWQPIETAPTDGTVIMVIGGSHYEEFEWNLKQQKHPLACRANNESKFCRWISVHPTYYQQGIISPTHWMPLPPLPDES